MGFSYTFIGAYFNVALERGNTASDSKLIQGDNIEEVIPEEVIPRENDLKRLNITFNEKLNIGILFYFVNYLFFFIWHSL